MNRKNWPVIATIPAYNAETTLGPLIQNVLEQEYDDVYVLDDASTDNTVELANQYLPDIKIVRGQENLGPGGNRNRIIGYLGRAAIIHFLDADVKINSKNTPEIVHELGVMANLGFVGGLVRNPDEKQNPYNYGPRPSLWNDGSASIQYLVWTLGNHRQQFAKEMRTVLHPYLRSWPNIFEKPHPTDVFWTSEANLVTPSNVFVESGGFDPQFRFSEIFDFAIRLNNLGLKRLFDPSLDVTHKTFDTAENKKKGRMEAAKQLRKKYGRTQYVIGARAASALKFSSSPVWD